MSAELPKVTSDYVSNRLEQLERRLEQAKQARDEYVESLKNNHEINNQRPSLMRRLEIGQYFWNSNTQPERYLLAPLPTNDPIPSGMVLNSDFTSMTKRLREIGSSIRNLRDYRLSMPSDEYFKSVRPHLRDQPDHSAYYGDPNKADLPSLAEIRSRILTMQFNVEKRSREILDQRIIPTSIDIKPPEWLNVKDLPTNPDEKPKEPEIKEKPAVISSNRQIVFDTVQNEAKPQSTQNVIQPDNSKNQYNKMLNILRPKQVEVSSSDESDVPITKQLSSGHPVQTNATTSMIGLSADKPDVQSKQLPSFLQTNQISTLNKPTNEDSDSDFFK